MIERDPEKVSKLKQRLQRHLPILKWAKSYKKSDFVADFIAGITLGLTLIPQSVAYASLAGVSAQYGLYSSFMGAFVYVIFGTVKEVSVGPTSLISLLTFEFTRDLPIEFVFLFTLMCGCIEFLCGLLQFGFLISFISTPVTTSFQSAVSLIIIASQLKDFLGIPKFKSGRFLSNIYNVLQRIPQTRLGDVILSLFCCCFLLSLRKLMNLKIMKEKNLSKNKAILKKALWFISISRNAICVFISCFIAYAFSLRGDPPFRLSGDIPSGLPPFRFPPFSTELRNQTITFFDMVYEISPGLFVIPLVSILANVTIAKAFSSGKVVDATQEMITLGLCNISGSFFGSFPTCGAFTRSAVSSSSGVRTPLSGLFTGTLLIIVIQFLTPYFYYIPRATLASVLICAVLFMVDFKTIILLWKSNKKDFICAIITFSVCLLLGVQTGLVCGIIFCTGHLLYIWARPSISVEIKETNLGNYYLVTPDIGLFYPASDFFQNKITSQCVEDIPLVIDCAHFKGIDYTVAQCLKQLGRYCSSKNQNLVFINVHWNIYTILNNSAVQLNKKQNVFEENELHDILFQSEKTDAPFAIILDKKRSKNLINCDLTGSAEEKSLIKNNNTCENC